MQLTGVHENITTGDGTEIAFKLLRSDANRIKKLSAIMGTKQSDSFITIGDHLVSDMAENPIVARNNGNAHPIDEFTADTTPPQLLRFSINLDKEGDIVMTFDETVSGSSVNPSEITLRDSQNPDNFNSNHTLTGAFGSGRTIYEAGQNFSHEDSDIITIGFLKVDLDEVKRLPLCSENDNCFLIHTEYLVDDMYGRDIERCD